MTSAHRPVRSAISAAVSQTTSGIDPDEHSRLSFSMPKSENSEHRLRRPSTIYSHAMAKSDSRGLVLRSVAIFKFMKAALMFASGIGALRLANKDISAYVAHVIGKFHLNPGNRFVARALARTTHVTPRRLHEIGIVAFVYAALFLTEGIGLWSLKPWGEWITVLVTGLLLPFEIYEIWHRPTVPKVAILVLNAVIVLYLIIGLRKRRNP